MGCKLPWGAYFPIHSVLLQYMLDYDKGQTKHLSSMSSLWRTTRMSRWMTPTLTTVFIRPFLNFFSANALLLMFSAWTTWTTWTTSIKECDCDWQTSNPGGLSHADCQVRAADFSAVRKLSSLFLSPRSSNSCSSAKTPSSNLPRFMLAAPKNTSWGSRPISLWSLVIFSHFEMYWSRKTWSKWILHRDL